MGWRAFVGIGRGHFDMMLIDVIAMWMVQVTIVEIVRMTVVRHGRMATIRAMMVGVVAGMFLMRIWHSLILSSRSR